MAAQVNVLLSVVVAGSNTGKIDNRGGGERDGGKESQPKGMKESGNRTGEKIEIPIKLAETCEPLRRAR